MWQPPIKNSTDKRKSISETGNTLEYVHEEKMCGNLFAFALQCLYR